MIAAEICSHVPKTNCGRPGMLKIATKFLPQRAAFETAYRAGCRWAEFWLDAHVLADWRGVAALARQYPLRYALHFPNQKNLAAETLENLVHLHRALDATAVVIHRPQFELYAPALLELEPALPLGVENHRLTLDQFYAWAEQHPGLTLDVEHFWKFTLQDTPLENLLDEVRTFLHQFGGKLRHVHLPGYLPGFGEHRPMYCSREMIFGVFSLLSEAGYQGLIVSETNEEHQHADELRMDLLLFETWRGRSGK